MVQQNIHQMLHVIIANNVCALSADECGVMKQYLNNWVERIFNHLNAIGRLECGESFDQVDYHAVLEERMYIRKENCSLCRSIDRITILTGSKQKKDLLGKKAIDIHHNNAVGSEKVMVKQSMCFELQKSHCFQIITFVTVSRKWKRRMAIVVM